MSENIKGRINSIQSLAALDGPGIRYAVFMQGCNLRCGCCHNPDTHRLCDGYEIDAAEIVEKATRYRTYFGKDGGITLSGGEPLMQAEFACEVLRLAKEAGINTCLDTSGSIMNEKVKELLGYTDRVLLDVKYTTEEDYEKYVGCSLDTVLSFLDHLQRIGMPTTLRQVIIPTLNDSEESIGRLKAIKDSHPCIDKIELLPFKKLCSVKYDKLGIPFPFESFPEPTSGEMKKLEELLNIK